LLQHLRGLKKTQYGSKHTHMRIVFQNQKNDEEFTLTCCYMHVRTHKIIVL
jgi:hypothetical protein